MLLQISGILTLEVLRSVGTDKWYFNFRSSFMEYNGVLQYAEVVSWSIMEFNGVMQNAEVVECSAAVLR